ncbi:DUF5007 domain-containing protein [Niabella hirudinis]|uniref:DUF5007 domain-containing protein n=1 Tax=Niabella hirudinis TaxID=1285929 RepID=UPI003EB746A0
MKNFCLGTLLLLSVAGLQGCYKKYLPSDKDAFDLSSQFTTTTYQPFLGRTTLFADNFTDINSSRPLSFRMLNIRTYDGGPAPELQKPFPVQVWTEPYTGLETSLAAIEAKRKIEEHPVFEIRDHSGEFIMWQSANSNIVRPQPDSGYVFDVEVSNKGGRKIIEGLRLLPYREQEYAPNKADIITGNVVDEALRPGSVSGMIGDSTESAIYSSDVEVTFHKVSNTGSSLTFRFLDADNQLIDPAKFNLTKWATLIHGFNMKQTSTYVKYDVAYPIPLVQRRTAYTNIDGTSAHLDFGYERIGFGGQRQVANMQFDFAIYTKGDWEIIFAFKKETPKFSND